MPLTTTPTWSIRRWLSHHDPCFQTEGQNMGVDIISKERFDEALEGIGFAFRSLGVVNGQYEYLLDFGNQHAFIRLCSSIAPDGYSRECGEDSIRAWLVDPEGNPLGKTKVGNYTTRKPGWAKRLEKVLTQLANLGRWIQPCPNCQQSLLLAVKGDKAYLFCPSDSQHRDEPGYVRHLALTTLDKETGQRLQTAPKQNYGTCPDCGKPLVAVQIGKGKNKGKVALSCPAKDANGRYLNHYFQVMDGEAEIQQIEGGQW